ncbi:MAG: hypothetical protein EOP53_10020 [Sphingobacteriales bacterium]|nr:MAG: hypothetical protein EOP53_10020 [Sphingobacteriales bacterium]
MLSFLRKILFLPVLLLWLLNANGQGMQTEFGKSILQYKPFEWYYYQSSNFDVYFYTGGKELARYAITMAEENLREIETKIDYSLDNHVTFVIYNSYSDFRQSNFTFKEDANNGGGRSRVQEDRVFIYFNGDHFNFTSQIRSGIAQVLLNEILYGGSLQERVQSNVLLNMPTWYGKGLIEYLGEDWNADMEDELRNGILSGKFKKFKKITESQSILVGHSIWKYVNDQYGEAAVANMLYIMRAQKSVESGYLFVLGKNFSELYDEWYQFNLARFKKQSGDTPGGTVEAKLAKVFKKGTVSRWDISPRGEFAAVVTNDQGKEKIWVVNMQTGKKKRIYTRGYRRQDNTYDYNYPVIAWNTRGQELTVIFEDKSVPTYILYNAAEKKKTKKQILTRIERVLSVQYSDNGRTAVMSVVRNGQTDICTFDFRSAAQRFLTNDIYDDLDPRFVRGNGIVFSSNRPDLSLEKVTANKPFSFSSNYDIFYFPDYTSPKTLKRLSNSTANESMPDAYDTSYFSYLTDENGIINRNAVYLDSIFQHIRVTATYIDTSIRQNDTFYFAKNDVSTISLPARLRNDSNLQSIDTVFVYKDTLYVYPLTNYSQNILSYIVQPKTGNMYELFLANNKYVLNINPLPKNIPNSTVVRSKNNNFTRKQAPKTSAQLLKNKRIDVFSDYPVFKQQPGEDELQEEPKPQDSITKNTVKPDYFQTDFPAPEPIKTKNNTANTGDENQENSNNTRVKFSAASLYFLNFTPDFVIPLQLDNSLMNSPYVPYSDKDNNGIYSPSIRGMFKIGLSDMFKDYRLVGGVRVLGTFRGAEYFMSFDNIKNRLDKRLMFFRRGEVQEYGYSIFRTTSHEMRGELRWPFSETQSVRFSGFGRLDKITYLSGELISLKQPNEPNLWAGTKAEYVLDNVIPRGMNLFNGTRLKVYTELFNSLNKKNTLFTVIGADVRNYTKISRQIIWANRFAAASSIGQSKVVYFLGGVDNWLMPKFNNQNIVDPAQNYVYKAQATNLRGFDQNIRNGSSYAVFNSELRVPLLKYLFNKPFRSLFFENFQVVGFADAGSSWTGVNPFSIENAYNKRIIQETPFTITVTSLRDPMVYGYGFGFRSVLLGYFIKVDYAWGREDDVQTPRKTYISLGMDF